LEKAADAFRTISEVAEELDVPQHVLRFWETRFSQIRPMKRGGGRRYYRVNDVDLLKGIRALLYGKGYTIKGVQRIIKERGVSHLADIGRGQEHHGDSEPASDHTITGKLTSAKPTVSRSNPPKVNDQDASSVQPAGVIAGLTDVQKEELKLAYADLSAAKRILTGEKKT